MDKATFIQHGFTPDEAEEIMLTRQKLEEDAINEGEAISRNKLARSSVSKNNHNRYGWPI